MSSDPDSKNHQQKARLRGPLDIVFPPAAPAPGPLVSPSPLAVEWHTLAALRTPGTSNLRVELTVLDGQRDTPAATFRIGQSLRFAIRVTSPCRLLLLDFTTSGKCLLLYPNCLRPEEMVDAGELCLPRRRDPECELPVEGPAGTERVLAVAGLMPWPWPLGPWPAGGFREVSATELAALTDLLERASPGSWATAGRHFAIQA